MKMKTIFFVMLMMIILGFPIMDSFSQEPNPSDFRESESLGSIEYVYAYSGLSLVGIVMSFFVIKKWKNRK